MDVHTRGQITYCGQVTVPPQTQNFSEVVLPLMSFSFLNAFYQVIVLLWVGRSQRNVAKVVTCFCCCSVKCMEVSLSAHRNTLPLFKVISPDGYGNRRLILSLWDGRDEWKDWMVLMVFSTSLTVFLGVLYIKAFLLCFQVTSNLPHNILEHMNASFPGNYLLLLFVVTFVTILLFSSVLFSIPDDDWKFDCSDQLVVSLASRFST